MGGATALDYATCCGNYAVLLWRLNVSNPYNFPILPLGDEEKADVARRAADVAVDCEDLMTLR